MFGRKAAAFYERVWVVDAPTSTGQPDPAAQSSLLARAFARMVVHRVMSVVDSQLGPAPAFSEDSSRNSSCDPSCDPSHDNPSHDHEQAGVPPPAPTPPHAQVSSPNAVAASARAERGRTSPDSEGRGPGTNLKALLSPHRHRHRHARRGPEKQQPSLGATESLPTPLPVNAPPAPASPAHDAAVPARSESRKSACADHALRTQAPGGGADAVAALGAASAFSAAMPARAGSDGSDDPCDVRSVVVDLVEKVLQARGAAQRSSSGGDEPAHGRAWPDTSGSGWVASSSVPRPLDPSSALPTSWWLLSPQVARDQHLDAAVGNVASEVLQLLAGGVSTRTEGGVSPTGCGSRLPPSSLLHTGSNATPAPSRAEGVRDAQYGPRPLSHPGPSTAAQACSRPGAAAVPAAHPGRHTRGGRMGCGVALLRQRSEQAPPIHAPTVVRTASDSGAAMPATVPLGAPAPLSSPSADTAQPTARAPTRAEARSSHAAARPRRKSGPGVLRLQRPHLPPTAGAAPCPWQQLAPPPPTASYEPGRSGMRGRAGAGQAHATPAHWPWPASSAGEWEVSTPRASRWRCAYRLRSSKGAAGRGFSVGPEYFAVHHLGSLLRHPSPRLPCGQPPTLSSCDCSIVGEDRPSPICTRPDAASTSRSSVESVASGPDSLRSGPDLSAVQPCVGSVGEPRPSGGQAAPSEPVAVQPTRHGVCEDEEAAFVHLVSVLMEPDPLRRWSALEALRHPFITGAPWSGPNSAEDARAGVEPVEARHGLPAAPIMRVYTQMAEQGRRVQAAT